MLRLNSLLLCCKLCSVLSFDHIWVRPWWDPFLFFIKVCGPQNCHSWLNHLCLQVVQQLQVCNAIYYRAIGNQAFLWAAPLCEPWQQLPSISRGPWFDFFVVSVACACQRQVVFRVVLSPEVNFCSCSSAILEVFCLMERKSSLLLALWGRRGNTKPS